MTGDVVKHCKNRWSNGGHDNSGQVQARTVKQTKISFFSSKTSKMLSRVKKYTLLMKNHRFKVKDTYLALNFVT